MKLHLIPLRQLENHIGSILRAINIYPPLHPTQPFIAYAKKIRFSFSSPSDWRWKYGLGICGKWFPNYISSSTTYEKVFPKLWIFSLPKRNIPQTRRKIMNNPFTLYEQEVLTALYKSLNYCEEYDLPTYEISESSKNIKNSLCNFF